MFRGINNINLDAKGRMAVPTRYRQPLYETANGSLVITINHSERCLWIMPINEWLILENKVAQLPNMNSHAQRLQRILIGHATEADMDKSGRLLIPPPLRDFAGLDKHVVLVGQVNKFELWSEPVWNDRRDQWLAEEFKDDSLPIDLESLSL